MTKKNMNRKQKRQRKRIRRKREIRRKKKRLLARRVAERMLYLLEDK